MKTKTITAKDAFTRMGCWPCAWFGFVIDCSLGSDTIARCPRCQHGAIRRDKLAGWQRLWLTVFGRRRLDGWREEPAS